jgi:hypothetical protein
MFKPRYFLSKVVFDGTSPYDFDVGRYAVVDKLLDSIFNMRGEVK